MNELHLSLALQQSWQLNSSSLLLQPTSVFNILPRCCKWVGTMSVCRSVSTSIQLELNNCFWCLCYVG